MPNPLLYKVLSLPKTNKSGGAHAQGDVCVEDSTNANAVVNNTTGAYASSPIWVCIDPNGVANNAVGQYACFGYVPKINLSGSASLGDVFKTHTVAKQAVRHAAPFVVGDFGIVLATGSTPPAFLWGAPIQSVANSSNVQITFDVGTTTDGQNQNRTSGLTYTAHRAYITIYQPLKLTSVKWDVSSAKTYTLKLYRGWQISTVLSNLGDQTTSGRTAEVTWSASDILLMPGKYTLELTWTGAAVVDDNTADGGTPTPKTFQFFEIERTEYNTTIDNNQSAAIKLDAKLGTTAIV